MPGNLTERQELILIEIGKHVRDQGIAPTIREVMAAVGIDKSIADDPSVYPGEATMRRLYTVTTPNQPEQKLITRLWTQVKTGR